MAAEIEQLLRSKCQTNPILELLHSQWVYDKRLVGQALQSIGALFTTYSQHDASHSNTILVQITRVLGERIERLSATDLWMLLEAAYWHDLGMVVDDATVRKWWDTPEFKRHLEELSGSDDDVLADAARLLIDKQFRCEATALDIKHATTLIVADFARGKHADRSGWLMHNPLSIGLHSPRVLIPTRLFRWVGQIAMAHGKTEDFVNKLPQSENGMGTDVCHPRFIACMLRLGDLLDLDNGRFCPVLAATSGKFPATSLAHVGKHASIQRFCVSPEKIEVEAVCDSRTDTELTDPYAVYEATSSWLGWLEGELRYLAGRWNYIAPPNFGGAPSIGTIEAKLIGFVAARNGDRPRFKIDETAFFDLIRSNRLYQEPHAWLRELIANAEDATRIRAYVEKSGQLTSIIADTEPKPLERLAQLMKDYPVQISVSNDKNHNVHISIEDKGTGISTEDLGYVLTIGSSKRNPKRREIVLQMPSVMKPTGAFGLGLQSVFMVTDEVVINTGHFQTREQLEITLKRKSSASSTNATNASLNLYKTKRGATGVYAKDMSGLQDMSGTRISFTLKPELLNGISASENKDPIQVEEIRGGTKSKNNRSVTRSIEDEERPGNMLVDPVLREIGGLEVEYLADLVRNIAKHTSIPIELNGQNLVTVSHPEDVFFSHRENCSIRFLPCTLVDNPVVLRYRGAEVPNHGLANIGLIDIEFDMHFGDAVDILTASRDALTPYGLAIVKDKLKRTIDDVFPKYLTGLTARLKKKTGSKTSKAKAKSPKRMPTIAVVDQVQDSTSLSLARASLYAFIYLNTDRRKLDSTYKAVPLVSPIKKGSAPTPVGIEALENEREFLLFVGDEFSDQPRPNLKVFKISNQAPRWISDALIGQDFEKQLECSMIQSDRYLFYKAGSSSEGHSFDQLQNLKNSCRNRLWRFSSTASFFRIAFPSTPLLDGIALDYTNLPTWVDSSRLLLARQIVSPFEFRVQWSQERIEVRTSHLAYYLKWLYRQITIPLLSPQDKMAKLVADVKEFAKTLVDYELYIEDSDARLDHAYIEQLFNNLNLPTF